MKGARLKQKPQLAVREGFYFMEVCDQVQAINVVLREKDIPLHIFVEPRRISTQSYDGTITVYPLTLEVDPSSCSSMRYKTREGLVLRLQIQSMEEIPPADVPMGTLVERLSDAFERLNGQPCSCSCRTCGINLFKQDVKFTRVLSLPSEHWEDLSSSWTCCSHGKERRLKTDQYPFVPRFGEIFENDFFVIFHPNAVVKNNVILQSLSKLDKKDEKKINKSTIKCARCFSVVGEAQISDSGTVRTYNFYKSAVEFRSIYEGCLQPIFSSAFKLERVLANEIANDVKTNTVYKFLLQGNDKKPYLMIQVLSTDARLRFHKPEYCGKNDHTGCSCCCLDYPPRYLGAEEWEMAMPKMMKADKEKALKDSKKSLERALSSMETLYDHMKTEEKSKESPEKLVPPDIWFLYSFSPNFLTVRQPCEFDSADDDCGVERVVKVLYASATTTSGERIAKEWQQDLNVRTLTFPYSMCMNAMLILISSTLSMPVRRIAPDDFLFGFLRLE